MSNYVFLFCSALVIGIVLLNWFIDVAEAIESQVTIDVFIDNRTDIHKWTKAIYNPVTGWLTDWFIECNGDVLVNMTATHALYVGEDWIDSRPSEWVNKWC